MKHLQMKVNTIIYASLFYLFLFLSPKISWEQDILMLDMSKVLNAKEPRVIIYVLSQNLLISVPIQEKRFDELLTTQGDLGKNIYVLDIRNSFQTKCLAKALAGAEFVPRHNTGDGFLDTRYKFCFFDGDTLLQTVYADSFAEISYGGKVWEGKAKRDKLWLYNFWESIRTDLYLKPHF